MQVHTGFFNFFESFFEFFKFILGYQSLGQNSNSKTKKLENILSFGFKLELKNISSLSLKPKLQLNSTQMA